MSCIGASSRSLTKASRSIRRSGSGFRSYATLGKLGTSPDERSQKSHATSRGSSQTLIDNATAAPSRPRLITPFNDDGTVPWKDLSVAEKAARTTQQTFNFGLVMAGVFFTGVLVYTLFDEVFMPESKTRQFSRAVRLIKMDRQCTAVLGPASDIWAHGEPTINKWQRSRPIASSVEKDDNGVQHLLMQFYVEGTKAMGTAHLHMARQPNSDEFEYKYLFVDVKGHTRIYVKRDETTGGKRNRFSFLGMKW